METTKRATIRDVANLAGVGKVTVSYVLNGQSKQARISSETEKRVLKAATELNYRPNVLARMLATQRTDMIAVVFQRGSIFTGWSPFTAEVMRGVSTAAVELGYDLMLHTKDTVHEDEAGILANGRIDGALVLRDEDDLLINELTELGFPAVRFFSRGINGDQPYVDADNYSGGRLATHHLIELGHQRIAMIRGTQGVTSSNDRFSGYRDAIEGAGQTVDPSYVLTIPSTIADWEPLRGLMKSAKRPTALFVWSDDVALAAYSILRELGLRIPEDVSVVGFDSLDACNLAVPPLTSVRQPVFEMAQEATRLVVDLIQGNPASRSQILFPLLLDVRGSTAPCSTPNQRR